MSKFRLESGFSPTGDQPRAIGKLYRGIQSRDRRFQTLLGVTGSGKTFSLACLLEKVNLPVLVISPNKTLASQLYAEFRQFFPHNAVEYFVSYYDYYQPESYLPETDTYIEKDASVNERLDRLRLSATSSLLSRKDVIVVASVSCIYNLGSPQDHQDMLISLDKSSSMDRDMFIERLVSLQYERDNFDFRRCKFRVTGDTVDVFPSYRDKALRVEFFGDVIEKISEFDPLTGKKINSLDRVNIYPAKHFIMAADRVSAALSTIEREMEERVGFFRGQGKILEAERLRRRTRYDMEMLKEMGYCHGIENYSMHLSGRPLGARPYCLLDYFPDEFLTIIDESHVTIPQIRGMYNGDRARKQTLVEHGFRLVSCLENRPLKFDEFFEILDKVIFVSATPADFEIKASGNLVVEQIIRPTGLLDPEIEVRPTKGQIQDILAEIKERTGRGERVLITTLTKRMSEELAGYLKEQGVKVEYLHSEIKTINRAGILKDLRTKKFDCLVGVNLIREGLDLPEVSLVIILNADREGFLRSATSLIQIAGRCARNVNGRVLMYADSITGSMEKAIMESRRRRKIQSAYNSKHNITPASISKAIQEGIEVYMKAEEDINRSLGFGEREVELIEAIARMEKEMTIAARNLRFEKAALLRDRVEELKKALDQEA